MRLGTVLFLACWAFDAWPRILVVSDIDDTLKISHVRSTIDAIMNAPYTDLVFAGMPELFQTLRDRGDIEFIYLSNAPAWLMTESHSVFLETNGFPAGRMLLRPWDASSLSFKREALNRLIDEDPLASWVLIGDNGERDPLIYWDIMHAHPALDARAFIHAIYPDNIERQGFSFNLRPYGSAYDLALEWVAAGLLKMEQIGATEQAVHRALLRDLRDEEGPERAFAPWTDCHPALNFHDARLTREWADLLTLGCALGR